MQEKSPDAAFAHRGGAGVIFSISGSEHTNEEKGGGAYGCKIKETLFFLAGWKSVQKKQKAIQFVQ